jgi:hypothetical protein
LPGSLNELEEVVALAEQAPSMEAAANAVRPDDIDLPGAVRWIRRRVQLVQRCLVLVLGLLPEHFAGCTAQINSFRSHLGHDAVLMALREFVAPQLPMAPPPLGFSPHSIPRGDLSSTSQQPAGPDPPL